MGPEFRQLIKHGSVFALGQVLGRVASVLLLPVYTRLLTPSDYGVMAVLDLLTTLLALVLGGGIASAATRAHFLEEWQNRQDAVWWTAIFVVTCACAVSMVPTWMFRHILADVAFGPGLPDGSYYLTLATAAMLLGVIEAPLQAHLRALKESGLLVGVSLARLVLNVAINVALMAVWQMGLAGLLWGNLATAWVVCAIYLALFIRSRGPLVVDRRLVRGYWSFGWPLIATGLLSTVMHQADRYILRFYVDFEQVGIYSIAYQIGQGVNTLVLVPFFSIWGVLVYEIASAPHSKRVYADAFKYFTYGLASLLLMVSLFARPIISTLAPGEYLPAADILPIVCLAYLFFSSHSHFNVPALIAGKTVALLPSYALAACLNVGANLLLIPVFGAVGAAWATVATFVVFAGVGLFQYRKIDRYPYALGRMSCVIAGMSLTVMLHRWVAADAQLSIGSVALTLLVWAAWSVPLLKDVAIRVFRELRTRGTVVGHRLGEQ